LRETKYEKKRHQLHSEKKKKGMRGKNVQERVFDIHKGKKKKEPGVNPVWKTTEKGGKKTGTRLLCSGKKTQMFLGSKENKKKKRKE